MIKLSKVIPKLGPPYSTTLDMTIEQLFAEAEGATIKWIGLANWHYTVGFLVRSDAWGEVFWNVQMTWYCNMLRPVSQVHLRFATAEEQERLTKEFRQEEIELLNKNGKPYGECLAIEAKEGLYYLWAGILSVQNLNCEGMIGKLKKPLNYVTRIGSAVENVFKF